MSERQPEGSDADAFGRALERCAAAFAIAGGVLLALIVATVVVSILGRAVLSRPVPGDFEIVGMGAAISIFLFLPYCYMRRANVAVDIFFSQMPDGLQRLLDGLAALLFASIAALFAWRMILGLLDTLHYGDISMIVGLPLWWAYPFAIASFVLSALSGIHTAVRRR